MSEDFEELYKAACKLANKTHTRVTFDIGGGRSLTVSPMWLGRKVRELEQEIERLKGELYGNGRYE